MAPKKEKKSASGSGAGGPSTSSSADLTPEQTQLLHLFSRISLSGPKAVELTRLPAQAKALEEVIQDLPPDVHAQQVDQKMSGLIVLVCAPANSKSLDRAKRKYLVGRVLNGDIDTSDRVTGQCPACLWAVCAGIGGSYLALLPR